MVGYARRRSTGMKRMASVEQASRSSGSSRRRNKRASSSLDIGHCLIDLPQLERLGIAFIIFGSSTKSAKATCIPRDTSSWQRSPTPCRGSPEKFLQLLADRLVLSPPDLHDYVECEHLT